MSKTEYSKQYYRKNREKINFRSKLRYLVNRERILAHSKEMHLKNRERHILTSKIGHYKRKFGITLEERNQILSLGCQICFKQATQIDHNHKTGKVRGGLCNNCNTGLGMFKDSQAILIAAVKYISKNETF